MKKLILSISILCSLPICAQLTFAQAMKKLSICIKERMTLEQTLTEESMQDSKTMEKFNQIIKNHLIILMQVLPHMCTDQYLTNWKNKAICLNFIHQFIGLTQMIGQEGIKALNLNSDQLQSFMQNLMIAMNKLDHMVNAEIIQSAK